MWPSVPSNRKFGSVACPLGDKCSLPYCIFDHDASLAQNKTSISSKNAAPADAPSIAGQQPQPKRLKMEDESTQLSKQLSDTASHVFVGSIASKNEQPLEGSGLQSTTSSAISKDRTSSTLSRIATRPISPPSFEPKPKATSNDDVQYHLTPRKLQQEPDTYARRLALLRMLHQYMVPLNDKLKRAVKPEIQALWLNANLLNKMAVDEEEKIAKEHPEVYENVLKQRIAVLKKMTIEEWVKMRREAVADEKGNPLNKAPAKKVVTGLSPKEEVIFLSRLAATEAELIAHGVLTRLHTEADLAETRITQQLADFWEVCDRCNTRFQVFPDRRQCDGALTTGGPCQHHWGRKMYPKPERGQPKESPRMTCCHEPMGSSGCTTFPTHVFKVADSKRLSLIMPFIETPENDKVDPDTAVCFDCEMGYTTHGLELLRLTAISWPKHKPLVDVLVRPLGHILDFNTRFSGVTSALFLHAKPYDPENPKPVRYDLRIVDSPYIARELLLSHVSPRTPILGHAIENDLNTIRLVHPTVVDTVILFPTRSGLPYRHGLKALTKMHLNIDIQQGGVAGHDSYEDAKSTGELVRVKVAEQWKKLHAERWTIREDGVYPPLPPGPAPPPIPPIAPMIGTGGIGKDHGKRKRDEVEDNEPGL